MAMHKLIRHNIEYNHGLSRAQNFANAINKYWGTHVAGPANDGDVTTSGYAEYGCPKVCRTDHSYSHPDVVRVRKLENGSWFIVGRW